MDYKKTSDMLALSLFGMLTGLIFGYVPIVPSAESTDLRYIFNSFGELCFFVFSVMLLVVLLRWAYRLSFGTVREKAKVMDEKELKKHE